MEFIYYPLALRQNKERQHIPGAVVMAAPRGAHRHRREDLLAILLDISGDHHYTNNEIHELAEGAANAFFREQGSVTRAMQQACNDVNRRIMERNLSSAYEGIRAGGTIGIAVLHKGWLFVCLFGCINVFLISSDKFEQFGKAEGLEESLGQTKYILPRFYQSELKDGDLILLNSKVPSTWTSYYLAGCNSLEMPQLKLRLLNQVTTDIEAVVIRARNGDARVVVGDWQPPVEEAAKRQQPSEFLKQDVSTSIEHPGAEEAESILRSEDLLSEVDQAITPANISPEKDVVPVVPGHIEQEVGAGLEEDKLADNPPSTFLVKMAHTWMRLRTLYSRWRLATDRIRKKIAPKSMNMPEPAAPAFLVMLALILPLALVLLSFSTYTRIGRTEQYETYMHQAQQAADLARQEKDAVQQYAYWAQALEAVRAAETYRITQESHKLFEEAQFLLDEMDLAARLDFRPALTQFFPEGMVLTRIQAGSSGVYLLDSTSGSVLRLYLNTKGFYEIDDEFKCMPGPYGLEKVTNLIDFAMLPANAENFRVVAIDASGNLLYCRPGEVPLSRKLPMPENGFGRIASVAYEENMLYILDAENDAIWMYAGKNPDQPNVETAVGMVFAERPMEFFDEDVPDLGGAIDLAVNQEDVYILHEDGHMTTCRYSSEKEVRLTECEDPAPYGDNRVGRQDKRPWIFTDTAFRMLQATRLPNSSIYILDALNTSIYQFSYQLNLERVLRPQYNQNYPLPEIQPSGFGISQEMEIFLAFGNKLFIAPLT